MTSNHSENTSRRPGSPSTQPVVQPLLDKNLKALKEDIAELEEHDALGSDVNTRVDSRKVWRWVVFFVALAFAVFHVLTSPMFEGSLPARQQGPFHVSLALCLIFLLYPVKEQKTQKQKYFGWFLTIAGLLTLAALFLQDIAGLHVVLPALGVLVLVQAARYVPISVWGIPLGDVILSGLSVYVGYYVFSNYATISRTAGILDPTNIAVGTAGLLLVLVAAQRVLGSALVILASLMLAYAYYGPVLPSFLRHGGISIDRIVNTSFFTDEAIFGTPVRVSATIIFLFLIFAAILQRTGMERFFTDVALGTTGWSTGGTAKVGVATSAFSGTITGSSVANTVSNGAFTIPMMKKSGYKANYAGAVEAASSTGGQIAPPIMGAGAFIMMEITGIPYADILKAAIIPAILFFVAQFVVIHFDSKKMSIGGIPKSLLPSVRQIMGAKGYLLIPIVAIFILLSLGFSPAFAAMSSIGIAIGINILVQLLAPVVFAASPSAGPLPAPPPPVSSRLVGSAQLLGWTTVVGAVSWLLYVALAAVAPGLSQLNRMTIAALALGVVVAIATQVVTRRKGFSSDEDPADSFALVVQRTWQMVVPFVLVFAVLWLVKFVVELALPDIGRAWSVVVLSFAYAAVTAPLVALFGRWRSESPDKLSMASLVDGLVGATRIALPIVVACAAAGILAGMITLTGLGHKLADGLIGLGGGYLIPVLALSMLACLILGIGLPTTANYVVTATLAAPAIVILLQGDLPQATVAMVLSAHLFVYYFGVMADITPPVCLAAYAACGVSGGDPIRTGGNAVRIAISGFVVPFFFVISPELLLQEVNWVEGTQAAVSSIAGVFFLGIAVVGYFQARISVAERLGLAAAGLLLVHFGVMSDVAGLSLGLALTMVHIRLSRAQQSNSAALA
ncbi:TRAP transporter fused permease subunit [Hoyosella rhizosphaerae]|uniref:C4-dicarboxylate ABC transporter n=1 Tax=Hoyosella rhizosphaerae TaxID=1755582 RepID=A0A916U4D0_9ACTN|nr:TRAP transporter fused permease subunit [Hoyosella rhizosphaerae]MBN4926336.1 TRAP transporter fused permease subunit [Hoyosella rhizosphaerae]GGC60155.1 C4-dicarboxylate ABC transporter [Hoyosella rhizosphaerae]